MKSLHPFFTLFCAATIFSCARENISTDGAAGLIAFKASGNAIVSVDTKTDVIVAYLPHPAFHETNTLIFKHIFARLRKVTMDVPEGYAVSDVNVKITPGIGGQFDIRSGYGQTDGSGIRGLVITGHGGFSSSSLFLPAAGRCYDTTIDSRGKMGNYRSRSLYTEQSDFSWDFCFEKDVRIVNRNYRYMGCSIRPVLVLPE